MSENSSKSTIELVLVSRDLLGNPTGQRAYISDNGNTLSEWFDKNRWIKPVKKHRDEKVPTAGEAEKILAKLRGES